MVRDFHNESKEWSIKSLGSAGNIPSSRKIARRKDVHRRPPLPRLTGS